MKITFDYWIDSDMPSMEDIIEDKSLIDSISEEDPMWSLTYVVKGFFRTGLQTAEAKGKMQVILARSENLNTEQDVMARVASISSATVFLSTGGVSDAGTYKARAQSIIDMIEQGDKFETVQNPVPNVMGYLEAPDQLTPVQGTIAGILGIKLDECVNLPKEAVDNL